jgi:hypothetical protein
VTVRSHISRGLATLRLRIRTEQDDSYSPGEAATA